MVQARRAQLGLSQQRLAQLSGLSRVTVNQLERGSLNDIGIAKLLVLTGLLGIDITAHAKQQKAKGLFMAAVTSNVSHRSQLGEADLAKALASGVIPSGYKPHIAALLNEAPLEIIVKAVEESARKSRMPPKKIWRHIWQWTQDLQCTRVALCQ